MSTFGNLICLPLPFPGVEMAKGKRERERIGGGSSAAAAVVPPRVSPLLRRAAGGRET